MLAENDCGYDHIEWSELNMLTPAEIGNAVCRFIVTSRVYKELWATMNLQTFPSEDIYGFLEISWLAGYI